MLEHKIECTKRVHVEYTVQNRCTDAYTIARRQRTKAFGAHTRNKKWKNGELRERKAKKEYMVHACNQCENQLENNALKLCLHNHNNAM